MPTLLLSSFEVLNSLKQDHGFAGKITNPIKSSQLHNALLEALNLNGTRIVRASPPKEIESSLSEQIPLQILLAEDNLINQKVGVRILNKMGYQVDVAANGLEVLEALERRMYDVILMDMQMPEMDGVEATKIICKRWSKKARPRIIALTANAITGDREKCLQAGMDDYTSKPIDVKELTSALKRCRPREKTQIEIAN